MNNALKAEWITAVATAVQTIAVVVTVIVAGREWLGHERDRDVTARDITVKLYSDEPQSVTDARSYLGKAYVCESVRRDHETARPESPHYEADENFLKSCPDRVTLSPDLPQWQTLYRRVRRAALCSNAEVCNSELVAKLFCEDFAIIRAVAGGIPAELVQLATNCRNLKIPVGIESSDYHNIILDEPRLHTTTSTPSEKRH